MLRHFESFIRLLRRAGLPVSQGELLDFCRAIELLAPSRENMLLVMQATLVKETGRQAALEKLFDYYFTAPGRDKNRAKNPAVAGTQPANRTPRLTQEEFNTRLAGIKDWLRREIARSQFAGANSCEAGEQGRGGPGAGCTGVSTGRPAVTGEQQTGARQAKGILDVLSRGNPDEMTTWAKEAIKSLKMTETGKGDLAADLIRAKVFLGWAQAEDMLARTNLMREAQRLRCLENLAQLDKLLRQALEKDRLRHNGMDLAAVAEGENLSAQDFASLDTARLNEMKRLLVRLGRRLATRPGYRSAPARRGPVDMRRTVRLAAATGGVPLLLCRQKRLPQRPELVVCCDFSGSVAPYSRFMLLLIYAMQHKFHRMRTFAFVDAVAEITGHLKDTNPERAVRNIVRRTGIWQTGFSDYGAVWEQFYRLYAYAVNNKTTLLVLGDARNNYKPPGTEYFREICRRARRVIWLNPAPEEKWDREDSVLHLYAPYCRRVYPCRNLSQLTRITREVF